MKACRWIPLLLLPLLASCNGGGSESSGVSNSSPEKDEFRVGLLTSGPISDAGWNAMAYEGLESIKSEMNATIDNQQATGSQIRDALRSYAQKNYNLVFGHGYEYNEPAFEVAKDFPNTIFISSSGGMTSENVGAFRFALEEGFYLAGMMGALMSKTGKIGSVSIGGIPSIDSTLDAFEAGAKAAKPGIQVSRVRIQTDGDVASAKRATEELISSGADFVIHQANASAPGVFEAAKERGVYAFGSNQNQNDNESGVVIASAVIVAKPAFLALAREVKDKTFKGRVVQMGMKDGAIEFYINPRFTDQIPAEVRSKIDQAQEEIKSGALEVPMAKF